jgi:O-antigen ligase
MGGRAGGDRPNPVGVVVGGVPDRAGTPLVPAALSAAAIAIALGYFPALDAPFVEPKLAVLLVAGALGLGGHLVALGTGGARPRWRRSLAVAAWALLLTTVIAALVAAGRGPPGAPYAAAEILRLGAVLGVALGAAQVAAEPTGVWRRRLPEAIHAGAALVSLLGILQHLRILPFQIPTISVPGSTFGNRNIAAEAVAAAIPFGLGLIRFRDRGLSGSDGGSMGARGAVETAAGRRWEGSWALPAAVALVLELGYLAVARTRGAWLGGALGMAVFFALRRPIVSRTAVGAALAIGAAVALAVIVPGRWTAHDSQDAKRFAPGGQVLREALDPTSPVARTRIGLWRRTLAITRAHPLWGVGPGSFPVVFPRYAEPGATEDGVLSPTAVPRRAHNDLLERLAETGPLGVCALLAVYLSAAWLAIERTRRARRVAPAGNAGSPDDSSLAAASAGSLTAIAASGLTGFPLAMPATAFLFGVALGLLATDAPPAGATIDPVARNRAPGGGVRLASAWIAAALVLAGAGWWSARRIGGSYFLGRAEAALRAADTPAGAARALPLLSRAARALPGDFKVALRTAYAAGRAGQASASVAAAERALAIEPDSANAWEALARARLDAGDATGAEAAAGRALEILHDYPGALSTRALAEDRLGDGAGAARARARLTALGATNPDARRLAATPATGAR